MYPFLPLQYNKQQRTPPTPAPPEDRFLIYWSSIRTGSPLVQMPPQSILVREKGQEINQPTIQTSQPDLNQLRWVSQKCLSRRSP